MSVVSFNIFVDDLDSVLALFDVIEVWRSTDELGTYSEITAPTPTPATLDGTTSGPWNLSSSTLAVVLNGADPVSVNFTGTDPLNLASVIAAINHVIPNLAKENPTQTNKIRLESPLTGTGSSIQVSGGAAIILGLSTLKINGFAARVGLTNPTDVYLFRDYDSLDSYWYKTRYLSTATNSVSSFSGPRQGNPKVVLSDSLLSKAVINLVDGSGHPVVDRRIIFVPTSNQLVTSVSNLFGSLVGVDRLVATTDSQGHAEIGLLKGQTFRVFFEGTSYQREFEVPDTDFDLLTVLATFPDPFSIYQAPPMPIRSS